MANQEHVDILKQGVDVWNKWREKNPDVAINLSYAHLDNAHLNNAHLARTDLSYADLGYADLSGADLSYAHLNNAHLNDTHLNNAHLNNTYLSNADLRRADLSGADLSYANLSGADLSGADLSGAKLWSTVFVNIDLRTVKGLETVKPVTHLGPSSIGIDTIYRSQGKIPESFLKRAGVPDSFIDYMRSLVGSPFDYYSCFISYSSTDQTFAERLYADLQSKGVRCWYAPHDMKIGDEVRPRIDESIRVHDKLLLVLSESSIASAWVKKEVETAFEKEDQHKKLVLFPVRLDDAVMHTSQAWAADIRRMRHIGDFTHWKEHDDYQQSFARLLRDLKTEVPGRL